MDEFQVDIYTFFGVAEVAVVLMVVSLILGLRGKALMARVLALQSKLRQASRKPEPVAFDQYLRDELIRNQALIDEADAAGDEADREAAELLRLRKQFLELELAARAEEKNPVKFQGMLTAGFRDIVEMMRPEAQSATLASAEEPQPPGSQSASRPVAGVPESGKGEVALDTHDQEFDRLKQLINNQQDAMSALRAELKARESDIENLDGVLNKLDEFEQHDAELRQCLRLLQEENQRLKAARSAGEESVRRIDTLQPAQLAGLKSMIGSQERTISNLENLIRELAPEASKASELQAAVNSIQRANRELSGCVAVLEDENALLRAELEAANARLEQRDTPASGAGDDAETSAGAPSAEDDKQQLEIRVQELEALLEFKDAAIEELEKQYSSLESKYLALAPQD